MKTLKGFLLILLITPFSPQTYAGDKSDGFFAGPLSIVVGSMSKIGSKSDEKKKEIANDDAEINESSEEPKELS